MLLFILAATMALEAAVGFLLRLGSEQYKDSPAMAVPFLMLRDGGNKRPSHNTGTPTQPGGTELPTSHAARGDYGSYRGSCPHGNYAHGPL